MVRVDGLAHDRGLDRPRFGRRFRISRRRAIGCLGFVMAVVVLMLAAYLGLVGVRRSQVQVLPAYTGEHASYPIGRIETQLITSPTDPTAKVPMPRTVSVWLWYPTRQTAPANRAAYAPGAWNDLHLPGIAGFGETLFDRVRTRSVAGAPIDNGRYGLVILQPGLGFAAPQYQTIAENLAAAGYVVAGVTPTHSANVTVIDGRAVTATQAGDPSDLESHDGRSGETADRLVDLWSRDARSVADALHHGRLGGGVGAHLHAGTLYVGHSFGGASALQACEGDNDCRGAVDLDGSEYGTVIRTGVQRPILLLGSEDSCITGRCGPAADPNPDDLVAAHSLIRHSRQVSTRIFVGTRHFGFTDYAVYYLAAPIRSLFALGDQDGPQRLATMSAAVARFADRTLGSVP